jgi:hypothetical protein
LKEYLPVTDIHLRRFEDVYSRYRDLALSPRDCTPMIIVSVPVPDLPSWEERLADPIVMLKAELDALRPHIEIGDDRVPTVRVQFGTAQVAAAFGCRVHTPPDSLPAAGSRVLERAEDVYGFEKPALDAGWYGKLADWTAVWQENLPGGIHIQHPDIQSAFNSAHLVRGNDILLDFYDHPDELGALLDLVTDFMIDITRHAKSAISDTPEWFFDWGVLWKGFARISNCSMQMISPEFYREHVLPRDARFFEAVGGGRIHYCGTSADVIDDFLGIPLVRGLDVDVSLHDFFQLCDRAPDAVTLISTGALDEHSEVLQRLLAGDWPRKRNIIVTASASSVEHGRSLLERLRESVPN